MSIDQLDAVNIVIGEQLTGGHCAEAIYIYIDYSLLTTRKY